MDDEARQMRGLTGQIAWEGTGLSRERSASSCDEDFVALVRTHSNFAFKVAHAVLRNRQDAEDAVQDAFLKLYRANSWKNAENERAFLARTVWRVAVELRKRQYATDPQLDLASDEKGPEQLAVEENMNRIAQRLIDGLPDELRLPLVLSSIEEMTSSEVGLVLGVPDATVRNRLMRARQLLRKKLSAVHHGG